MVSPEFENRIATTQWRYLAFAVVAWIYFVSNIPSALSFPWTLFNMSLGLLSPFFWYKTLYFQSSSERAGEAGQMDSPAKGESTGLKRSIYLTLGAVCWGIFVSNVPAHPIVNSRPLVTGILGFLSPFLWLATAYLNVSNNLFWRTCMNIDKPLEDETQAEGMKSRNAVGWFAFVCLVVTWTYFVIHLGPDLHWLWFWIYLFFGSVAPFYFLCALYLSNAIRRKTRGACSSQASSS